MGFQVTDITPLQRPSVNIPAGKTHLIKAFRVASSDTASSVKLVLPAQASVFKINHSQLPAASTTDAAINIAIQKDGTTISSGVVAVGATVAAGVVNMSGLPNIQPVPQGGDITLSASYGPGGSGGPWVFTVEYVV
jgi:hypothetical protein